MRAEAILRKILMILFLPPLTAPPQPSPSEADICCPYAPPAHKRDETFLQGQYLGCAGDTHTSCLCIALLPVKPPTLSFPCCCHPSFGRKVSFPSPEICSSLPMPPSRPLPTPGLSHPLLGALGTHFSHQSTAGQCEAFQAMLNSFSQRVISQISDPAAEKCPADKKGSLTNKMD